MQPTPARIPTKPKKPAAASADPRFTLVPASIMEARRALERRLTSPEAARAFLIERGFLTPTGRTPKKYGG